MPVLAALLVLAASEAPPPPELVALKAKLGRTRSLTANFTQKRRMAALKDVLTTEGTFAYDKGGKMRWRTAPPAESELVVDGSKATMRYPALGVEQAFDLSSDPGMARVFESILAVLAADLERLAPFYDLAVVKRSPLELDLKPKSPEVAKAVERIHLAFDARLNLVQVVLAEAGGDRTEIGFRDHVATEETK